MNFLNTVPTDCSRVESNHQVASPKRKQKDGHFKKLRRMAQQEIKEQLSDTLRSVAYH